MKIELEIWCLNRTEKLSCKHLIWSDWARSEWNFDPIERVGLFIFYRENM